MRIRIVKVKYKIEFDALRYQLLYQMARQESQEMFSNGRPHGYGVTKQWLAQ